MLVAVPELSLMGALDRPADAALYADLGQEEKVPVIHGLFSHVLSQPELRADAIHPNAQGYRRMAEGMVTALKAVGLVP